MQPKSTAEPEPGPPIAVLAKSQPVLNAVKKLPGAKTVLVCETLRELQDVAQAPIAALVLEVGCDPTSTASEAGVLLASLASCPVFVMTRFRAGDGRALAEICRWRHDAILPHSVSDLQRAIADFGSGHRRVDVVARIIAAVEDRLPGKLDDFRIFDAVLAQRKINVSSVARRCDRSCGTLADNAARAGIPNPRKQHGLHRAIIAMSDVIEGGLPEKQVAPNRRLGSESNLSRMVTRNTGQSIHDWGYRGGLATVLHEYAARFVVRKQSRKD